MCAWACGCACVCACACACACACTRTFTCTHVGEINGVTIIDDYAHHPVEISAVLSAAKQASRGKVIAVHQPHRYTRLDDLFEDFCNSFNDADVVGITDVYSAGEEPIKNRNRDSLVSGLKARGHRNAFAITDEEIGRAHV